MPVPDDPAVSEDDETTFMLSPAAWHTVERAARCLGLSQDDARDAASTCTLSVGPWRIAVLETPGNVQLPVCALMLATRLDMLDADDPHVLRHVLRANVHAGLCLGASAALDDGGRLLLTLGLHAEMYDPPALASMLLRFAAMAEHFAEIHTPVKH